MDEPTVRRMLEDVEHQIKRLDLERAGLQKVKAGYGELLALFGPGDKVEQRHLMPPKTDGSPAAREYENKAKGAISVRKAVKAVMEQAVGVDLTIEEILRRTLAMGAVTESQQPGNTVELHLYNLRKGMLPKLSKVKSRTWRLDS